MRTCFALQLFKLFVLVVIGLPGKATGQAPGAYGVGYRLLQRYDSTRCFATTRADSQRYRPVQIELFYPCRQPASAAPLPYGYFLSRYGSRMDFSVSEDSCRRVGAQLAAYLNNGLDLNSTLNVATLPTQSILAAPLAPGSFPLVLYLASYNGLSYENLLLLETLARRGYLVASIGSVGQYPGYMTMDPGDLLEQVTDAQFARTYLQQTFPIAGQPVAVLGYSWGGLAATVLAMQDPPVEAVVSLDGSDRYSYGAAAVDDAQFSGIRRAAYFQPRRLRAPYLYLSSNREATEFTVDSVYALPTSSRAPNYIQLRATKHEDFSSLPALASRLAPERPYPVSYALTEQLVGSWLDTYLRKQGSFADTLQALLRQHPTLLGVALPVATPAQRFPPRVLTGTTTDAQGRPLPYVSLGVIKTNQGTVSRHDGTFELRVQGGQTTDTLRASRVGYYNQDWSLATLGTHSPNKPLQLALREQKTVLPGVVIRAVRPVRRVLGNATHSTFFSVGLGPARSGAQVGIPLHVGNKQVSLEKVTVHISYNHYDSLLLQLSVYRLEKGITTNNLLPEQVLARVGHRSGLVGFDLTRFGGLSVTGDVVVAVELLEGWGDLRKNLFLSAGLLNGPSYYRQTSASSWRRAKGVGAGIQAVVVEEQAP